MPTAQDQQQQQEQFQQFRTLWEQQNPGQQFDPNLVIQQLQQVQQLQQQHGTSFGAGGFASDPRSQGQFDSIFSEQMFGDSATREMTQAYWQQAEESIRTARRISEIYALSVLQAGLVNKVSQAVVPQVARTLTPIITQQVLQTLQSSPQMLRPVVQQAMSS